MQSSDLCVHCRPWIMPKSFKDVAERQQLLLEMAQSFTYKPIGEQDELDIHFYLPKDLKEGEPRPVILFFHSGAFDRGSKIQFAPHALYFIERGAVCGLVSYRTKESHPETNPTEALQDGVSAIRFVRQYQEKLHIDPEKVVVLGAQAGATIAGCAAMNAPIPDDCEWEKNPDQNGHPNAAVLLSPFIKISREHYGAEEFVDVAECKRASLFRHIKAKCPPMLLVAGTADRLIPFEHAEQFALKMQKKRNVFEFLPFEGRGSNYFNLNVDPVSYEVCLGAIDNFLVEQGFLEEQKEGQEDVRVISWRETDF